MFKFFKEIKESIKEGLDEAKAEIAAENQAKDQLLHQIASQERPTLENIALALSCPYRETLTAGDSPRLFLLGQLDEKEIQSLRKLIYRDFEIQDEESMKGAMAKMDESLQKEGVSNKVFASAIPIYIITSCADVGIIQFPDYKEQCIHYIKNITSDPSITSWADFASQFMAGECINNALGRKLLQGSIKRLLQEKDSPWALFPWASIRSAGQ